MARRRRSFFFDNINKKLLTDTTKNTKDVKDDVDAAVVANNHIMTKEEIQDEISSTLTTDGYATQTYVNSTVSTSNTALKSYVDTNFSTTTAMNTAIASSNTAMKTYVDNEVASVDLSSYSTTIQMNTAIASSNTAMKTYVDNEVAGIVDSAPGTLNTLNELAAALGDDANFSTTTATSLGNRLRIDTAAQGLTGTQQTNALTNLGITASLTELNKLDGVTASTTELNYLDGVTSNIQTQLDGKQASGSYLTGNQTITLSGDVSGSGTTSIVVTVADDSHNHIISNVDGLQAALDARVTSLADLSITATATELNYVDGVTSNIQTQLNAKANLSGATFTGGVVALHYIETKVTAASGTGTKTFNLNSGSSFEYTGTGAGFTAAFSNVPGTNTISWTLKTTNSGTITWPAGVNWSEGVTPPPSSGTDIYSFISIAGTIYGSLAMRNAS